MWTGLDTTDGDCTRQDVCGLDKTRLMWTGQDTTDVDWTRQDWCMYWTLTRPD